MRLIIDTDTAGDDVFSLMLALTRPGVEVEAITIAHGNVGFVQHAENALVTLERCGKAGVPVYPGAERPFTRAPLDAAYVFGHDGMSDSHFAKAAQRPAQGHAVDELVRRIMAAPGEITLIAQAPLTNIALAYLREHDLRAAPVVDEDGRVIGMARRAELQTNRHRTVAAALDPFVHKVMEATPIAALLPILSSGHAHEAMVVDAERRLIGVITQTDLIAALYRAHVVEAVVAA